MHGILIHMTKAMTSWALVAAIGLLTFQAAAGESVREAEMSGYMLVGVERVPNTYDAGFSMYVAAWPLLRAYPGHRFQSGLFGTWMHAQYDGKPPENCYSDVEGGLGWWRDTRFPTETPKFIMGGVAPNFTAIANGPAHGNGNWDDPKGLYGVAQLSPRLLFPIDGLNFKQGTSGELVGYGYLTLPLTPPKAKTDGKDIPTGANCWTLFLNTNNFKGPVAFFTPYFWSHATVVEPRLAGLLLDTRGAGPNRPLQMETQYVPAVEATDGNGETYARIAPTSFPRSADGSTTVVHRITAYSHKALWDGVKTWFDGGTPASGAIDPQGSVVDTFKGQGGSTWQIDIPPTPREQKVQIAWKMIGTPAAIDQYTFGYHWNEQEVTGNGSLVTLPEYYHLTAQSGQKSKWLPIPATDVPAETGLSQVHFDRPHEKREKPYTTPDDLKSCWKTPGPAAGPFQARLGDGSIVTYYWYRFADQPALLNADLTKEEREAMQARVEKLHRAWTMDREYLAPPTVGKLADMDPALIVTPPKGLEIGYVPIATRQE